MGICKSPNLLLYRVCEEFSSLAYKSRFEMSKCDRYEMGRDLYKEVVKLASQCATLYTIKDNKKKYEIITSDITNQYYLINLMINQILQNDMVKDNTKIKFAEYITKIYEQIKKWENHIFSKLNESSVEF